MTGSVESAQVGKKGVGATTSSPADLLRKAVDGTAEQSPAAAAPTGRSWLGADMRLVAAVTVSLVIGTGFGLLAAPREHSGETLARIEAELDAGRTQARHLNSEIERLSKTLASLGGSTAATQTEMRSIGPGLTDRIERLEQGLDKRFNSLAEKVAHSERAQDAPLAPSASAADKRNAAPPATTNVVSVSAPKAEPTQTASITETKPDAWALRDIYDGIAILEDRKRRLLEVAPGDSIPGLGRVDSIERRGRTWVVVTKQGIVTPQTW